MTCIIGLVDKGEVWVGGDSFCEQSDIVYNRASPKVFRRKSHDGSVEMLIGCAGSAAVSQILEMKVEIPPCPEGTEPRAYIGQIFAEAALSKVEAHFERLKEKMPDFSFIVAYAGMIFQVDNHWFVLHEDSGLVTAGWGDEVATGVIEALADTEPFLRITRALEIASKRTSKVAAPYHIFKL